MQSSDCVVLETCGIPSPGELSQFFFCPILLSSSLVDGHLRFFVRPILSWSVSVHCHSRPALPVTQMGRVCHRGQVDWNLSLRGRPEDNACTGADMCTHTYLDSCTELMIPELHSEVILIMHLPLRPCVNAALGCIKVHDQLFIMEDCTHAQIFFLDWQPPHVAREQADCNGLVF